MLLQAIGGLLPAAVAVALSPIPIVGVILVLGTPRARVNGPAFALGWVVGLSVVSVLVVLLANRSSDPTSDTATGVNWMKLALAVLLFALAVKQWNKRPKAGEAPEMPGWMTSVSSVSPGKAVVLGLTLSGVNPKNLALTAAAAASIAQSGLDGADKAVAIGCFVVIASLTVVGSVLAYLVAPRWAARPLGAMEEFMAANSATIMMVILVIFGAKLLGDALAGLWG
jgi:threonine/homoserine/homoserine lactone efflux protein